jgi:hypothetical protein
VRFTVGYTPEARDLLAEQWLAAVDREAVKRAADEIDRALAINPMAVGESRVVNIRIILELPLGAYYDVKEADRSVTVWRIWRCRKKQ